MTSRPSAHLTPERWRNIELTLERALELPARQRADFLDRACAGDADLRREVESLLASEPGTGFLERPVLAELSAPDAATAANAESADRSPADGALGDDAEGAPSEASLGDRRGDVAPVVGAIPTEMARRLGIALHERYTVERELGRGGMATVYLARDLRHRRTVAIKVLYPELSAVLGPDRFVQEIELTASLQHPHILPLYESGNADGLLFYVMPAVDGETLRARLTRERHLPIADALRIAREVADALSYAHARGIVHRDVKPENILLQGEHALVADFGIALAVEHAGGERMTRTGLSPGTPQYMAPEQAMGDRVIDARADVYALGAVTYEMLAGEPAFQGTTAQAVLSRVLTENVPPLVSRRPSVPLHVAAAVHWAMERIPADRVPTAQAFAAALTDPAMTRERVASNAQKAPSAIKLPNVFRISRRTTSVLAASVLVALAGAARYAWTRSHSVAAPFTAAAQVAPVRFAIDVDSLTTRVESPALSPDGRMVVYVGSAAGHSLLMLRKLDEIAGHPIANTDEADHPFFSPDGRSVGFFMKDALWRVRLEGGKPELIARPPSGQQFAGASWGSDDAIIFAVQERGLFRVAAGGDSATLLWTDNAQDELSHPQLLPDGRSALVTVVRGDGASKVGVVDLTSGRVNVLADGAGARYAKGYIVFVRGDGSLYRQPFDVNAVRLTGSAERIEQSLDTQDASPNEQGSLFDVAPNGTIAFRAVASTGDDEGSRLLVTDRTGRELQTLAVERPWSPRFSPDGSRIAFGGFSAGRQTSDIWIADLATDATTRLTNDDRDSNDPRWSPDGKRIAFSAATDRGKDLFVQTIGSSSARALTNNDGSEWPTGWTPNGDGILYTQLSENGQRDVWLQPLSGASARPIIASSAQETSGALSPDGRWILYQSDESGRAEVYVDSYPVRGRPTRVSTGGGMNPLWRRDGREIFFWSGEQLLAALVDATQPRQRLTVSAPVPLFRAEYVPSEMAMYDVSADGTRIVLVANAPRAGRLVVATGMLVGARWP